VITFVRSGWEALPGSGHDPGAIALTSVFFDPETGTIVTADMEFNAEFFEPVIVPAEGVLPGVDGGRVDADLENTLTHEVGHFLGLDHSADNDATMFFQANEGEIKKRDLAQDDVNGVCDIYPAADDPGACEPAGFLPKRGLFARCAVAAEEAPGGGLWLVALIAGALFAFSRRRPRR
jgi:MYXO-CTERM domain-containing protein